MYTYIKMQNWMRMRRDEKGASAVEYGLLIALIAAVIVVAVILLGTAVSDVFQETADCVEGQTAEACPE
jgi:pilus assembly protein Flp/PilA